MLNRFRPFLFVIVAVVAVAGIVLGARWLAERNEEAIVQGPDLSTKKNKFRN